MRPLHASPRIAAVIAPALALLSLVLLVEPTDRGTARVPRDYNEGWNAYHAAAAARGTLYPPPGSWFNANYPPLSFELLGRFSGPPDRILTGRALALVSLLAAVALVLAAGRRMGATTSAAATGALWLLAVHAGFFGGYVAMDDPQWLGHALGMLGLVVLMGGDPTPARLAGVALALGAAGLVKHNLLPLPLAITAWFVVERPRAAVRWLIIAAVVLASLIVACRLHYGPAFFDDVLGTELHRPWSVRAMRAMAREALPPLIAGAAAALLLIRRARREPRALLVVLYFLASLAWGAFTAGGLGVGVNAFFDLSIAAALAVAMAFDAAASRWPRAVALVLLGAPVLVLPARVESLRAWRATRDAQVREARDDVARVAAVHGPVLCESLALCYWAGKPVEVDLFSAKLRMERDPAARQELLTRIARREFGAIQVTDERALSWFLPGAAERMRDRYEVGHRCPVSGLVFVRVAAHDR